MAHTIVLVQPGVQTSRIYEEYDSVNDAMEGICHLFEEHLIHTISDKTVKKINYDIIQLFEYIDTLTDINCLVYQRNTNTYAPYTKEWIKEKIYLLLRRETNKEP